MRNVKQGGAAFPSPANVNPEGSNGGMSLRDWFAGQALAGTLANPTMMTAIAKASGDYAEAHKRVAESAYESADAMIVEREKGVR